MPALAPPESPFFLRGPGCAVGVSEVEDPALVLVFVGVPLLAPGVGELVVVVVL
jgi:hypothetical protein